MTEGRTVRESGQAIEFGPFRMVPSQRLLLTNGEPVPLGSRAYDLLLTLVGRSPDIISKDDLMRHVWGSQIVGENTLAVHLSTLRKALGDATDNPRYIATVPRRGYRFLAATDTIHAALDALSPQPVGNLPRAGSSLIGRSAELDRLLSSLSTSPLVTLTGPGGIGKTRLAIAAGERISADFRDGVWWVDLAPVQDPGLVAATVAHRLGLELGAGPVLHQLAAHLRELSVLLILDNCEHVVGEAAALAAALRDCERLRMLATSQEPLWIAGEHVERLDSLELPDAGATLDEALQSSAVQLFLHRAQARASDFTLDRESLGHVVRLCRRLEGVPLALELAAARAALLGAEPVAQRLDKQLIELSSSRRDVLPRHQTLRALLMWSYGLLTVREQLALRRLAAFAGGCTLDAAEAVIADDTVPEWQVGELLSSLIAKSLVVARQTLEGARYRLLDTTRLFARERLVEAGEEPIVMRRIASHLCRVFEEAEPLLEKSSEEAWATRCLPELDNLRAALDWCYSAPETEGQGLALTGFSLTLMEKLGDEGKQRIDAAFARLDAATPAEIASALWLGRQWIAVLENDFEAATEAAVHGLACARASGRPLRVLRAGILVARAQALREQWRAASDLLEELKQICETEGFTIGAINTEAELAQLYILEGRLADAILSLDRASQLNARRNDPLTGAFIASDYVLYHAARGDLALAADKMREAWELAKEATETDLATICCRYLIALYLVSDQAPRATEVLKSVDIEMLISNPHVSRLICFFALAIASGEDDMATRIWGMLQSHAKLLERPRQIASIIFAQLMARPADRIAIEFPKSAEEGGRLSDKEAEATFKAVAALYLRTAA